MAKMPLQHGSDIASLLEKVMTEPIVSFDALVPFDAPIEQLDFEVHQYSLMIAEQSSDGNGKEMMYR